MKVYELIQQLAKYDADADVRVEITGRDYTVDVTVEEDAMAGEDITANIDVHENIEDISVMERTWPERYVELQVEL